MSHIKVLMFINIFFCKSHIRNKLILLHDPASIFEIYMRFCLELLPLIALNSVFRLIYLPRAKDLL